MLTRILLALGTFIPTIAKEGGCYGIPKFYTEKLTSRSPLFNAYVTKPGVGSLHCCARLCAELEFCAAALYDSRSGSCSISYTRPKELRCHQPFLQAGAPPPIPIIDKTTTRRPTTRPTPRRVVATTTTTTTTAAMQRTTARRTSPTTAELTTTPTTSPRPVINSTQAALTSTTDGRFGAHPQEECFIDYPQQVLVALNFGSDKPATFVVENGLTLDECKCYCASSWLSRRYSRQCESMQYYPDRAECFLNDRDHQSRRYDLANLVADRGTYFRFPCHRTELAITQYILGHCRGLLPPPQPDAAELRTSVFADNGHHMCFDVQHGYVLAGQSREVHHDVSMQQCMCACAGATDFTCLGALYYSKERDCTLALRNRIQRPDMFRRDESSYDIVYLGYSCSTEAEKAGFLAIHCPREFPSRSSSLTAGKK